MTIDFYIRHLLYRNDCVIVPDFGAFLVKKVAAKVSLENDYIEAPKRTLSFNPQLKNDDGLLISYVSENQNISFREAKQQVEFFVKELTTSIQRKKEVIVEDLGKFSFNENQFLSFESVLTKNYLLNSFGLDNTSLSKINSSKEETKIIPISRIDNDKSNFKWAKYAASIAALFLIASFLFQHYQKNNSFQHEQVALQRIENKIQEHIQKANFSISPFNLPLEIELPKENLYHPFHVVGGAFRSYSNAVKKVNQLKNLGYDSKEIGQNTYGLYQVVYQSFLTREEAIIALTKIREDHNQNAWLLVQ